MADPYRYGSATAQSVDVLSDSERNLGVVSVGELRDNLVDITEDLNRDLGRVLVDGDVTVGNNTLDVALTGQDAGLTLDTDTAEALASVANDSVRVTSVGDLDVAGPIGLFDSTDSRIDPATSAEVDAVRTAVEQLETAYTNRASNYVGLDYGRTSTSGSAAPLNGGTSLSPPEDTVVAIQALEGNPSTVYVGDGNVTTGNGYPLMAGGIVTLGVDDVSKLNVVGPSGETNSVAWIVEVDN